jgi:hypothetical protein
MSGADDGGVDALQDITAILIALAALAVFAAMIWAGQHQS